jgi:hypothetical protein
MANCDLRTSNGFDPADEAIRGGGFEKHLWSGDHVESVHMGTDIQAPRRDHNIGPARGRKRNTDIQIMCWNRAKLTVEEQLVSGAINFAFVGDYLPHRARMRAMDGADESEVAVEIVGFHVLVIGLTYQKPDRYLVENDPQFEQHRILFTLDNSLG